MVAVGHVAAGSRSQEQPVPGRDGTVPRVAATGRKERQIDGHVTRSCHMSPKAAGLGHGDMQWQARDRDVDRHAMQSEDEYLFSGLWKERARRRDEERETVG